MPTITIVIPTLNESGNIEPLLDSIRQVFQKIHASYEVIIVDDNSSDGTATIARKIAAKDVRVRVRVRYAHHGLGESIGDGIKMAKGEVIIGMDADMNHDPAVIPQLIAALSDADLVVASRFMRGGGMADVKRLLMSGMFNMMLRGIFGFPIWDNTSGYYAIRRVTLDKFSMQNIYYGYGEYNLRLVYEIMRKGMRIVEVPVFYKKRIFGQSKSRMFAMCRTYFREAYRLRKSSHA